jgi:hypothetical protein
MKHRSLKGQGEKLAELEQAIYEKRQQLNQFTEALDLISPTCLRHSMELDELINAYYKMLKSPKG